MCKECYLNKDQSLILWMATNKNKIVNIDDLRNIGKTDLLVKYAKEKNLPLIVSSSYEAKRLQKQYNYRNIFSSINQIRGRRFNELNTVVVDENVDYRELQNQGYKIDLGVSNSVIERSYAIDDVLYAIENFDRLGYRDLKELGLMDSHIDKIKELLNKNNDINVNCDKRLNAKSLLDKIDSYSKLNRKEF